MKTIQKIFLCVLFSLGVLIFSQTSVNAASAKISVSNSNPKPGEKVTVTGTATAGAWNLKLSGDGKSETIYGYTNTNGNSTGTKSITFIAGNAGEKYTFSLNGGMTDINSDKEESVSKTASIVVAKNVETTSTATSTTTNTNTNTNNNTSSQKANTTSASNVSNSSSNSTSVSNDSATTKEPKFTDVNKTATVTSKVNFRSSYSTTSSALGKIKEGESVTLLANGDNGWSKIKYNDKIGYIKTEFLSLTEEGTEEETQENEQKVFGLESLKIKDYELTPKFSTDIYEYTIETTDEIKELEITQAVANVKTAKVEIKGNENFKIGENIVKINITDDASDNTAIYTIKVKISKQEEIVEDEDEPDQTVFNEEVDRIQKDLNLRKWLIRSIISFVTVIIMIMFILRYRTVKMEEADYEYNKRDGYVIIDEKFDSQETDKEKIAKIEQFDEELENSKEKDIDPPIQPKRMKKSKGKHF